MQKHSIRCKEEVVQTLSFHLQHQQMFTGMTAGGANEAVSQRKTQNKSFRVKLIIKFGEESNVRKVEEILRSSSGRNHLNE